ncbi:MAG: DUF5103 domain-containing protein [Bacteroidetes bacterium]|nr:DUF5103 domain-containing protein [Bacteroidota bacterium]
MVALLFLIAAGCATTKEKEEGGDRTPRRVKQLEQPNEYVVPGLSSAESSVRTVQLYKNPKESNLPIIALGSSETLTLAFDLVGQDRRPLSVYFYHADRYWQRDLSPSQYLSTFHRDDILDYSNSRATEVDYVHYRYSFPNSSIQFETSGNFIVRVTEQGDEDAVILERPFYVSEQATPVDLGLVSVVRSGGVLPAVQPIALFTPPPAIRANVFGFAVCFIQNGRSGAARCTDQASLSQQPALEYYLQPRSAFDREASDYFLDLSRLDIGGMIESTNLTVSPYMVTLQPDFSQLGGGDLYPLLNGQAVVSGAVRDAGEPATEAEYVEVLFTLVPPGERTVGGTVHVVGSFNNWQATASSALEWVPDAGRYEGSVLIKQGQYEYRYLAVQGRDIRSLNDGMPRQDYQYTTFVYYDDALLQTDRLIAVAAAQTVN